MNRFAQIALLVQTSDDKADRPAWIRRNQSSCISRVLELPAARVQGVLDVLQVHVNSASLRTDYATRSQRLSHQLKV